MKHHRSLLSSVDCIACTGLFGPRVSICYCLGSKVCEAPQKGYRRVRGISKFARIKILVSPRELGALMLIGLEFLPDQDKSHFSECQCYLTLRPLPVSLTWRCAGDSPVGEGPRGALCQQRAYPSRQSVFCLTHRCFVFDLMLSHIFILMDVLSCALASLHMQVAIHRLHLNPGILS